MNKLEIDKVDRDTLLVEFQAFTGIDDIDECTTILEQHDWILKDAVDTIIAGYDDTDRPAHTPMVQETWSNPFEGLQAFQSTNIQINSDWHREYLSSSVPNNHFDSYQRLLNFHIVFREQEMELILPDSETVAKLKELISLETSIPESKIVLHGWVHKNDNFIKDQDTLRSLNLPKENNLYVLAPDLPIIPSNSQNSHEEIPQRYTLNIRCSSNQHFNLEFLSNKTVQEVKQDIFSLTNVPARHQIWTGWPSNANDSSRLYELKLQSLTNLEMKRAASDVTPSTSTISQNEDDGDFEYDSIDLLDEPKKKKVPTATLR